jgi:Dual specificity protein phosphatase, N-terminal half
MGASVSRVFARAAGGGRVGGGADLSDPGCVACAWGCGAWTGVGAAWGRVGRLVRPCAAWARSWGRAAVARRVAGRGGWRGWVAARARAAVAAQRRQDAKTARDYRAGEFFLETRPSPPPREETADALYYSVEYELTYTPFFADFGPLNLGMVRARRARVSRASEPAGRGGRALWVGWGGWVGQGRCGDADQRTGAELSGFSIASRIGCTARAETVAR